MIKTKVLTPFLSLLLLGCSTLTDPHYPYRIPLGDAPSVPPMLEDFILTTAKTKSP